MAVVTQLRRVASIEEDDLRALTDEEERLFTAISFGKVHKVAALLPGLRSPEVRDVHARTPLLHCARAARREHANYLIKLLLQSGSDVNAQDDEGLTSMMHVVLQGGAVDALRTMMRCA